VFGRKHDMGRVVGRGAGERPAGGRRLWRGPAGLVVLGLLGVIGVVCWVLVSATASFAGPPSWKIVASPSLTFPENSQLDAVTTVGGQDVWAVGFLTVNTVPRTLTEHWNGVHWSVVPSPTVPGVNTLLSGVAAFSTNDVWAVGFSNPGHTLTEHWNGAAWSMIPSPNAGPANSFNALNGVAAVSANNVWAVGQYQDSLGNTLTLIEHWNGVSWSIVPSPNVHGATASSILLSMTAITATDIWAVGFAQATPTSVVQTLTEHWNGARWLIVPSPNAFPGVYDNQLESVSAVSSNDVWAVGFYQKPPPMPTPSRTLIEHWNGSSWSIVPSPNLHPGVLDNGLLGVTAIAANDIWAVGFFDVAANISQTLTVHWDGSSWKIVPSPNVQPGTTGDVLVGVAAISTNDIWAVGNYAPLATNIQHTLTELYS
jgi:hypothetical protein